MCGRMSARVSGCVRVSVQDCVRRRACMSRTWSTRGGVRTCSYTISNSNRGGGSRGAGVKVREILVVVTQCLLLLNSYTTQGRVLGKE